MKIENDTPRDEVEENSEPLSQRSVIPPEALDDIPEAERDEFSRKLASFGIQITREEHYLGPLQPAREAERWNGLVPGSAERSFNLYERREYKKMEANDRLLTVLEQTTRHDIDLENSQHEDSVTLAQTTLKNKADQIGRGSGLPLFRSSLYLWAAFIWFIWVTTR